MTAVGPTQRGQANLSSMLLLVSTVHLHGALGAADGARLVQPVLRQGVGRHLVARLCHCVRLH